MSQLSQTTTKNKVKLDFKDSKYATEEEKINVKFGLKKVQEIFS